MLPTEVVIVCDRTGLSRRGWWNTQSSPNGWTQCNIKIYVYNFLKCCAGHTTPLFLTHHNTPSSIPILLHPSQDPAMFSSPLKCSSRPRLDLYTISVLSILVSNTSVFCCHTLFINLITYPLYMPCSFDVYPSYFDFTR